MANPRTSTASATRGATSAGEAPLRLADFAEAVRTAHYIRLDPETHLLVPAGGPNVPVAPVLFGKDEAYASSDECRRWSKHTKHAFYSGYGPDGAETTCVLLNSVAAEANLMEQALEGARGAGAPVPDVELDFTPFPETEHIGRIGALRAPHRGFDALLRDSMLGNEPFMQSELGRGLAEARRDYATPLLALPHMLVFGAWHTQGEEGGRGAKFGRAVVSEIYGYGARPIVSTGGRSDPVGIERKAIIYQAKDSPGDWTTEEEEAEKDKDGKPIRYGASTGAKKPGSPSLVNHGAIMPVAQSRRVMLQGAVHSMVLSLSGIRGLAFPEKKGARSTPERDTQAWIALGALALFAMVQRVTDGYHLRSGCDLIPVRAPRFQIVGTSIQDTRTLDIDVAGARSLVQEAVEALRAAGLKWGPDEAVRLVPDKKVRDAIVKSRGLGGEADEEAAE